jgi:hypothetical protein
MATLKPYLQRAATRRQLLQLAVNCCNLPSPSLVFSLSLWSSHPLSYLWSSHPLSSSPFPRLIPVTLIEKLAHSLDSLPPPSSVPRTLRLRPACASPPPPLPPSSGLLLLLSLLPLLLLRPLLLIVWLRLPILLLRLHRLLLRRLLQRRDAFWPLLPCDRNSP